jgi:hypothetical protein
MVRILSARRFSAVARTCRQDPILYLNCPLAVSGEKSWRFLASFWRDGLATLCVERETEERTHEEADAKRNQVDDGRGRVQPDAGPPFWERFRVGEILGEFLARTSCDTVSEG